MILIVYSYAGVIAAAATFITRAISSSGARSITASGFGATNIGALASLSSFEGGSNVSVLITSLQVNLPQLIFSSLSFVYNSLCTCMAAAWEWNDVAIHRKSLRVTNPVGTQRSTYWLQLPWKFSLLLIAASALLHWLISQSIFLVNLRIRTPDGRLLTEADDDYSPMVDSDGTITAAGYSLLAAIFSVVVASLLLAVLCGVGALKLKTGMPLVGWEEELRHQCGLSSARARYERRGEAAYVGCCQTSGGEIARALLSHQSRSRGPCCE